MKILKFDIKRGIYHFEVDGLNTTFHSHPVMEIIYCPKGNFHLETDTNCYANISFAIIKSNINHRVFSASSNIELAMVECYDESNFSGMLSGQNFDIENDEVKINSSVHPTENLLSPFIEFSIQSDLRKINDLRVQRCLQIMDGNTLDYKDIMEMISDEVSLSSSRISHLFKDSIGISLKKYLLWARTKRAMQSFLDGANLTEVAHKHGFFDQAHLTHSFSKFFGMKPSEKYNSRILQF